MIAEDESCCEWIGCKVRDKNIRVSKHARQKDSTVKAM